MIVGTAGHIDHGKTSLVKALTGVDTDRLKVVIRVAPHMRAESDRVEAMWVLKISMARETDR